MGRAVLAGLVGFLMIFLGLDSAAAQTLRAEPEQVYRSPEAGSPSYEAWSFNLVVDSGDEHIATVPLDLEIELVSRGQVVERTIWGAEVLSRMKRVSFLPDDGSSHLSLRRLYQIPEDYDFLLNFRGNPVAWEVDQVRLHLTLQRESGSESTETLTVPIGSYTARTGLAFPLVGRAIVTQGQFSNGGHEGHGTRFAIDVMGLGPTYGPLAGGGSGNAQFAGWDQAVLAPAAGIVVYARNDVPDNVGDVDPADVFGSLPDPILATAGNAVVIDHLNGEFSALMHMREGSVRVKVGDRVEAGYHIGGLGNSGDSFGPHLHYQLQDGPGLLTASSLPISFSNVGNSLERGTFLTIASPGSRR